MQAKPATTLAHNTSTSVLTPLDRWVQVTLIRYVPEWCGTQMLTLATLPISLAIVSACWLAKFSAAWLWCVSLLIAAQWITDTLDGAVGRSRGEGYVRWGYYMDHMMDYVFLCSMVIGYSLMVPTATAWFVGIAAVFAGFMVNTFLLVAASDEFKIVFYGVGPTEIRALFISMNSMVAIRGPVCVPGALPWVLVMAVALLAVFIYRCQRRLAEIDQVARNAKTEPRHDRNSVASAPPDRARMA